jgi:hypothetical protein
MNTYIVRSLGRRLSSLVAVSIVIALPFVVGCNGGSITYATPISVTITPAGGTTVGTGEPLAVSATSTAAGGVTWTLSGSSCTGAACGTLSNPTSSSVLYVAPTSIPSASMSVSVTATATIAVGPSLSTATTNLTVVPTTVTISPANPPLVPPGKSLTLTASVSYDVNNLGVKWSLSGLTCSGASCGSITQTTTSVTYTAPQGNGLQVEITATSIANPSVSTSVPVSLPVENNPVALSPTSLLPTAFVGQAYSATISASGGSAPYTFQTLNLPSWVTVTSTYDSVTFSGTPTAAGTLEAQVTVVDSSTPSTETAVGYYPLTTYAAPATNNALLSGSYAFYGLGSQDGTANNTVATEPSIAYIGSLTADGNGNITGGEVDINSSTGLTSYKTLTGTYNIGPNQLGTVTLIPPVSGVNPITLVVGLSGISSNVAMQGSFIEYDDSTGIGAALTAGSTGIRVTGSLAQQTTSSLSSNTGPLTGSYAFGMAGSNPSSLQPSTPSCQVVTSGKTYYYCGPVSLAGAMTMGTGGAITTGDEDVNQGEEIAPLVTITGTLSNSGNTDASGRITASITAKNPTTTIPLNAWPSDFIVYVVNPKTFYIMSSDSYVSNTLLAGEAMQQNLADIASTPFSSTIPIVAYSNTLSSEDFPNNVGNLRTEIEFLAATPTSATAGSMIGTTFANGAGTIGAGAPAAIAKFTYTVTANGRAKPSASGIPTMYLVDTGTGFGTNWDPAVTSGVGAATWIIQQQTSTALNAGTYVMSQSFANSNVAPLETGSIVIPAGGVPATGTSIPFMGYVYASYSEPTAEESNTAGALLYSEPITGTISNTTGVIPISGMTTSTGVMVCNNGGGYVISPTEFVCLSGTSGIGYAQVYVFQQ